MVPPLNDPALRCRGPALAVALAVALAPISGRATPTPTPTATSTDGDDASPDDDGAPEPPPIRLLLEYGAYYSSAGLYLRLGDAPAPQPGERGELEIYGALLRETLSPRFLVLEASVNPLPCAGVALRREHGFYRNAQLGSDLNLVRVVTSGFEEPWAVSAFFGNVASYDVRGGRDVQGHGYLGLVVSAGLQHIHDNAMVKDPWVELELKLKGDREAPEKNLSWSFRAGVKLHGDHEVTDLAYVALRRSRIDFVGGPPLVANAGAEWRLDLSLQGRPIRQLFLVDKKWPVPGRRFAFALGAGVLWTGGKAYTGSLAEETRRWQLLLRPNLQF